MNDTQTHLVPVLSGLGHARSITASDEQSHAMLDGRDFLSELGDEATGTDELVTGVPYTGAYCYRWIVIDLGLADTARRASVRNGAIAATRHQRGLIICSGWDAPPIAAEDFIDVDQIEQLRVPANAIQYTRFLLRTLGAARVLFASATETLLLADALSGHQVILACDETELGQLADSKRSSTTGQPQALPTDARIRQVLNDSPDLPHAIRDLQLHVHSGATAIACSQTATAVLIEADCAAIGTVLRCAPQASVATLGPSAVENYLVGGSKPQPVLPGQAPDSVIRIEELSDRDRNAASERVLFACLHLLGDTLAATPVIRSFRESNPDSHISVLVPDSAHARALELCPDIDALLLLPLSQHQIVYAPSTPFVDSMSFGEEMFDRRIVLDIQAVAASRAPDRHMTEGYADLTGIPVASRRPSLDANLARHHKPDLGLSQPPIVLSQHSVSGLIGTNAEHTKRWAKAKWHRLAKRLKKQFGLPIVSIGTPGEAPLASQDAIDLHCLSIKQAAALLADAALLITVDNGIYHLAQGLGTPTIHLYPSWLNEHWTACDPDGPHTDLRGDLRRVSVNAVFDAAARRLQPKSQ